MVLVSHLKRPPGGGHEEGHATSLSHLRGSHAIPQLSDMVIGLERNQQSEQEANQTKLRVLKNRFSGDTGEAGTLFFDKNTGRLNETNTTGFRPINNNNQTMDANPF
jgi:twinkle protein